MVGRGSADTFGFETDKDDIAELVYRSFGSFNKVADIGVGPIEEGGRRRTYGKSCADGVFNFLTGRLVERYNAKRLFGVTFGVANGRLCNRFDFIGL